MGNIIVIIYIETAIFLIIGILQPPTTNILAGTENHFPIAVEFDMSGKLQDICLPMDWRSISQ